MKLPYVISISILAGGLTGAATVQTIHAQAKAPAYVVSEVEISDPASYKIYGERQGKLIASFGGRFVARGGNTEALAGQPPTPKATIFTFESMDKLRAWHNAPEQKELDVIRDAASKYRAYAVEGLAN